MSAAEQAGHELLVALAGRLPGEVLWRLRDWLAAGSLEVTGTVLARELLRQRVALTDDEHGLLVASAGKWGAPRRLLQAVLPLDRPATSDAAFRHPAGVPDAAALSVLAVVRDHPGCVELRLAVRLGPGAEQRVVLVLGGERPWALTGVLQRVLRAHGDRTPCVEVLPAHGEPPAYHRAAIIGSATLWRTVPAEAVPV